MSRWVSLRNYFSKSTHPPSSLTSTGSVEPLKSKKGEGGRPRNNPIHSIPSTDSQSIVAIESQPIPPIYSCQIQYVTGSHDYPQALYFMYNKFLLKAWMAQQPFLRIIFTVFM